MASPNEEMEKAQEASEECAAVLRKNGATCAACERTGQRNSIHKGHARQGRCGAEQADLRPSVNSGHADELVHLSRSGAAGQCDAGRAGPCSNSAAVPTDCVWLDACQPVRALFGDRGQGLEWKDTLSNPLPEEHRVARNTGADV
jgi:hypothetical protein